MTTINKSTGTAFEVIVEQDAETGYTRIDIMDLRTDKPSKSAIIDLYNDSKAIRIGVCGDIPLKTAAENIEQINL